MLSTVGMLDELSASALDDDINRSDAADAAAIALDGRIEHLSPIATYHPEAPFASRLCHACFSSPAEYLSPYCGLCAAKRASRLRRKANVV